MKSFVKISISIVAVLPAIAAAQTQQRTSLTLSTLVDSLIKVMNAFIPLLVGLAIIFFFVGLIRYIYKSGDAKGRAAGRATIIWGLVGIFVIFTLWGILQLMETIFFSPSTPYNDFGNPLFPTNSTAMSQDLTTHS